MPTTTGTPPAHGTYARYVGRWRCRCASCRAANAAYQRGYYSVRRQLGWRRDRPPRRDHDAHDHAADLAELWSSLDAILRWRADVGTALLRAHWRAADVAVALDRAISPVEWLLAHGHTNADVQRLTGVHLKLIADTRARLMPAEEEAAG